MLLTLITSRPQNLEAQNVACVVFFPAILENYHYLLRVRDFLFSSQALRDLKRCVIVKKIPIVYKGHKNHTRFFKFLLTNPSCSSEKCSKIFFFIIPIVYKGYERPQQDSSRYTFVSSVLFGNPDNPS